MGMMPDIAVPLTNRGRYVARELRANLGYYLHSPNASSYQVKEAQELAELVMEKAQACSDRLDELERLDDYWF
jgi:hypothetical protein